MARNDSIFKDTGRSALGLGAQSFKGPNNNTYTGIGGDLYQNPQGTYLTEGALTGSVQYNPDTGSFINTVTPQTNSGDLFGLTGSKVGEGKGGLASNSFTGGLSVLGDVLSGVGSVMNARNAQKGLKMAKEQFDFSKAAANRNVANQAQLTNNAIQNAGEVGLALAGGTMDDAARANRQAQLNSMKVSGSPIG